jgi:two-component system chemotaxis sensor kinase CheA
MDMSQYRELFLSETREHINNLSTLVVTLEQAPDNRETIHALFREAHSIKGMAATMGFDRTAQLSHHLENFLDGFRTSGEVPSSTIDFLLAGIDLLDNLLADLQAGQPEREVSSFISDTLQNKPSVDKKIEDLEIMTELSLEVVAKAGAAKTAIAVDEQLLPEEQGTFQILVDLAKDTPATAARGILILRELEKSCELIASKPDISSLRTGTPCQKIRAWLRSPLARPTIEAALMQINGVAKVRFIDDRRNDDRRGQDEKGRTVRVRTDLLDQFINLTGELITHRYMLDTAAKGRDWQALTQSIGQTSRLIDDLHHHVLQARLMPLESITGRLPRIVRDLSRTSNKKVTLKVTGTDVDIDRAVLEGITDPLVHLVRNAVDHGIEKEGVVTVSARREKNLVLIEVSDDGKGMSPDRLRHKAVDCGLMTPLQAASLNDRDALMLVCHSGFSTAAEVTETSGRGVGMDVVKSAVNHLGGTLEILSSPNRGSRFQMRLPLSFAIIKILLISCSGHTLAIPITRVLCAMNLPTTEIQSSGQKREFKLDDEVISLCSLAEALDLPESAAGETSWIVLTEVQGRRVALQVDGFIGQREAFVKSIGFPMNLLTGLSGATIEGNGQVVFIIDPKTLLEDRQLFTNY